MKPQSTTPQPEAPAPTTKQIKKDVAYAYNELGQTPAFYVANSYGVGYEYCKACETDSPSIEHECLICGQTTAPPISREVEGFTELKLVRWAKDKYPPIDLNEQVPELLKLLASHQQQAKDIELLREALQNAKTDIYNWHNTRGGKKLTDIMGDFDLALKQTEPQVK